MATRDELRVKLQADVAPYAANMKVAEQATTAVVNKTKEWRTTAIQSTSVATGLAESLVVVSGSSTAAARGLTAVQVATKALALTPAGAAMTALGLAVGLLVDHLSEVEPEAEKAEEAIVDLAVKVDHSAQLFERQNKALEDMRQRVIGVQTATDDLAAGEEASLRRRSAELQKRARHQENEIARIRELTGQFSDQATQELRVGEALAEYLEIEKELVVVSARLGEIREKERRERAREAAQRKAAADRELASVIKMAQQRSQSAVDAAQKEEAARVAAVEAQVSRLRQQIQTAEERLDLEEQIAESLLEQGRITEEEHRKRMIQIETERTAIDHRWADFNRRLEEAAEDREEQAKELRDRITEVRDVTNDLLSSGVNSIFAEWTRDLEGAQRTAAEVLRTVVQIAQQALVSRISQAAFAGGGGSANWPRFATGGLVHGPGTKTSDSVVARLSRGEFVMRADAVERIGVGVLEKMNSMQMPRFANGGSVGTDAPDVRVTVANFSDDAEFERFLSTRRGERVVRNVMRRGK